MNGVELIKKWEGLRLDAYLYPAGIPTIGYGHTHGVKLGDVITKEEADRILQQEYEAVESKVKKLVQVPLTPNQLGALVSFTFNLGIGNLITSTLLKLLNAGKYLEASAQFTRWNKANGVVLVGLTNRRQEEKQLFNTP